MSSSIYLCVACAVLLLPLVEGKTCDASVTKIDYEPKHHVLTFNDLNTIIMGGATTSRIYKEIYSLDPSDIAPGFPPLPILRKTAIRWKIDSTGHYTNTFTGWYPNDEICVDGNVSFTTVITNVNDRLVFNFKSVWPDEDHRGTIFSSCPERYHINWYCPRLNITRTGNSNRKSCADGLRMSIYSAYGPNNLPWHLIASDLCSNKSPKMDDPRWYMTYDAPTACEVNSGSRKRRDVRDITFPQYGVK